MQCILDVFGQLDSDIIPVNLLRLSKSKINVDQFALLYLIYIFLIY